MRWKCASRLRRLFQSWCRREPVLRSRQKARPKARGGRRSRDDRHTGSLVLLAACLRLTNLYASAVVYSFSHCWSATDGAFARSREVCSRQLFCLPLFDTRLAPLRQPTFPLFLLVEVMFLDSRQKEVQVAAYLHNH